MPVSLVIAVERLQQHRRRERDRDARQNRARPVRHLAEDFARLLLRARQRARGKQRHECQDDDLESHPTSSKNNDRVVNSPGIAHCVEIGRCPGWIKYPYAKARV